MNELPNDMTEDEADRADRYGFDYTTEEEVETFRAWWETEGRFEEPPLRNELERRSPELARLDGEMRAVLGVGLTEIRALTDAATAPAFSGPKLKEAAAKIPPREDPVLDRWLRKQHEAAIEAAKIERERAAQEAKWAKHEAEENARLAAEAARRQKAEAAEAKRVEDAFTPEQRAALRHILAVGTVS